MDLGEEYHSDKVPWFSLNLGICDIEMAYHWWCWPWSLCYNVSIMFLHYKITTFPFPCSFIRSELPSSAHTQGKGNKASPPGARNIKGSASGYIINIWGIFWARANMLFHNVCSLTLAFISINYCCDILIVIFYFPHSSSYYANYRCILFLFS